MVATVRVVLSCFETQPDLGPCLKRSVNGTGIIKVEPVVTATGQNIVVLVSQMFYDEDGKSVKCSTDILVKMKAPLYPQLYFADEIAFTGKVNKPFNFSSDSGRSFDYSGYLAKDDIYFEIKSAHVKQTLTYNDTKSYHNLTTSIPHHLYVIKQKFVSHLNSALGEPHSALAAGLVVGEKSALGKELLDNFRTVGLIHIVVLSGFNITIVADALRKILAFLPRTWGIVIGGLGIMLFGILVGGGATVVRSCFMAAVALSADLLRRDYNVVRALIFAGLVMLIQSPKILLHDPSFQLSFLATLGLILLSSPIEKRLKFLPDKLGLRGTVASTFATQIFVSPFILYTMGQISIIGVVVNILVLPFIPATMLFVFLCGAGGFISGLIGSVFGYASHILLSYELFMVSHFAHVPFAAATLPVFSFYWVLGFYISFAIIYVLIARLNKKRGRPLF